MTSGDARQPTWLAEATALPTGSVVVAQSSTAPAITFKRSFEYRLPGWALCSETSVNALVDYFYEEWDDGPESLTVRYADGSIAMITGDEEVVAFYAGVRDAVAGPIIVTWGQGDDASAAITSGEPGAPWFGTGCSFTQRDDSTALESVLEVDGDKPGALMLMPFTMPA